MTTDPYAERIALITERLNRATPGPWHVENPDDDHFMNALVVVAGDEPYGNRVADDRESYGRVVAITLLQQPRYACIDDDRWDENSALISHAPSDIAYLLDVIEAQRVALTDAHRLRGESSRNSS